MFDDTEARSLAKLRKYATREFGRSHEIEWAIGATGSVVLQIRPVETSEASSRGSGWASAPHLAASASFAARRGGVLICCEQQ